MIVVSELTLEETLAELRTGCCGECSQRYREAVSFAIAVLASLAGEPRG